MPTEPSDGNVVLASNTPKAVYRVYVMKDPLAQGGLTTDCPPNTNPDDDFIRALQGRGSSLSVTDAGGPPATDLFFNVATFNPQTSLPVAWTRKYNAGRGTAGAFSGCMGETSPQGTGNVAYGGALFVNFVNQGGQNTVDFLWHFDYYVTTGNSIREHFTMRSGKIPFVAWTGENIEGWVEGNFSLEYYLNDGKKVSNLYTPIPDGTDLPFKFYLKLVREP